MGSNDLIHVNDMYVTELRATNNAPVGTRMEILRSKLVSLGQMYCSTERYFPVGKEDFTFNSLTPDKSQCLRNYISTSAFDDACYLMADVEAKFYI